VKLWVILGVGVWVNVDVGVPGGVDVGVQVGVIVAVKSTKLPALIITAESRASSPASAMPILM
jgi:hypothetical protein